MSNEALTLNEIYEISEICCTSDCRRHREGTCPYTGRDKISCYLWQIARSEYEDKRDKCNVYILIEGKNVKGVFHSLQRAKRSVDHLEDLDGYKIIEERIAYSDNGGVYHLQLHRWEWHTTWWQVC